MSGEKQRGYGDFAAVYDMLTIIVPYDEIADYYAKIISEITVGRRLLDMGCGTGNLTVRLSRRGFSVIGQDASAEMLSFAAEKSGDVQWICQNMAETELGEEVDAVISTLDSINHLESEGEISRCFESVFANLKSGGAFVFDVNTVYKHREILGRNTFVYDVDGAYCVWQNEFSPDDNGVSIELDIFFEEEDGVYTRGCESFREIALSKEKIIELLEKSEKLLFAAKKP